MASLVSTNRRGTLQLVSTVKTEDCRRAGEVLGFSRNVGAHFVHPGLQQTSRLTRIEVDWLRDFTIAAVWRNTRLV
jgi:hypothetical protein